MRAIPSRWTWATARPELRCSRRTAPIPTSCLATNPCRAANWRATTARGNVGERHLITNLIITPTKDGADGFAYLTMINANAEVHSGFYIDKLVKTPEGWRFGARVGWYDVDPASPYIPQMKIPAPAQPK